MGKTLKKLFKIYKRWQPYTHVFKERIWRYKYLTDKPKSDKPFIGVVRIDGRAYHGGMTDRFNGIISWWNYCRANGLTFKLWWVYPFELTDYIVPNEYDWRIEETEIPSSRRDTKIFYARGERGHRLGKLKADRNIWYYGNLDVSKVLDYPPYNEDWGEQFRKLFKPSGMLQSHLDSHRQAIGEDYVAVVYRFQQLLGDFKESHYKTLKTDVQRRKLIDKALEELDKIRLETPDKKILVASDSATFLNEAARKDYVYVVGGKVEHMDFSGNDAGNAQLKSFLDFYMIAGASKVYSIVIGDMYPSQFPQYAAKVRGVSFERRVIE